MISEDSALLLGPSLSSCMSTATAGEGSQCALAQGTSEGEHDRLSPPTKQEQQQHQGISSPLQQSQQLNVVYPPAFAFHEAVVADRDLFYDTLNKFHASLGTRLSIPTIGGKELDLHLLYVEVSSRGGLEQVIRERKWKEGPPVPPPIAVSIPSQNPVHHAVDNGSAMNGAMENGELVIKRRRLRREESPQLYEADFSLPIGHMVSGVIDGKFERGYLVTVNLGPEKLRGILYHLPFENITPQFASVSEMAKGIAMTSAPEVRRRRRRRRKDEMPKRDPNAPKPNRSGYNFFFQEHRRRLKALHPDKDKELSKMIGELWNKQTEEERAVYQERGVQDKERYKKEMELYRGNLNMPHCANGAGEGTVEGCGITVLPMDPIGRPNYSLSSLSETESHLRLEEEKPESNMGPS